jgi:hypothetical protein
MAPTAADVTTPTVCRVRVNDTTGPISGSAHQHVRLSEVSSVGDNAPIARLSTNRAGIKIVVSEVRWEGGEGTGNSDPAVGCLVPVEML